VAWVPLIVELWIEKGVQNRIFLEVQPEISVLSRFPITPDLKPSGASGPQRWAVIALFERVDTNSRKLSIL
jgi:hypothetical protein